MHVDMPIIYQHNFLLKHTACNAQNYASIIYQGLAFSIASSMHAVLKSLDRLDSRDSSHDILYMRMLIPPFHYIPFHSDVPFHRVKIPFPLAQLSLESNYTLYIMLVSSLFSVSHMQYV